MRRSDWTSTKIVDKYHSQVLFKLAGCVPPTPLPHLQRALLGAAEAAHRQLALLEHQVGGCGVVQVQVAQDVAVMMQHARPEGGADVRAALLALSRAGAPAAQRQVRRHLAPARKHRTWLNSGLHSIRPRNRLRHKFVDVKMHVSIIVLLLWQTAKHALAALCVFCT